jgi:hypothetical protein
MSGPEGENAVSNKAVDFHKSPAMPGRPGKDLVIAILLASLPVVIVAALIVTGYGRGADAEAVVPAESSLLSDVPAVTGNPAPPAAAFDYEAAANLSAARWRAMGEFYERNGMLAGDPAAAQAADVQTGRYLTEPGWLQAREYETSGINPGAIPDAEEDAYYTERYWKLAEPSILAQPVEEPEYDFYTQRYWEMADSAEPVQEDVGEVEWDYYTQRYWEAQRK